MINMNKKILALSIVLCFTAVFASINHLLPDEPEFVHELAEIEAELETLEDPLPGAEAEGFMEEIVVENTKTHKEYVDEGYIVLPGGQYVKKDTQQPDWNCIDENGINSQCTD